MLTADSEEAWGGRDTFCDVRFDVVGQKGTRGGAGERRHCAYSGKVFCGACMGQGLNDKPADLHLQPIPEKWEDPEQAQLSAVCTQARQELAVTQRRIQARPSLSPSPNLNLNSP